MKPVLLLAAAACLVLSACQPKPVALKVVAPAQTDTVSDEVMLQVYHEVQTPFKYGLVLAPEDNFHKYDCPTVFRQGNRWYMTYIVYNGRGGRDGRGYETWLAESRDLLHWNTLGRVLSFKDEGWDANQRAGYPSLEDMDWGGTYTLGTYLGKHWMSYFGGEKTGYEGTPLHIGMAYTEGDITQAHEWESLDSPIMSTDEPATQWFETITQYKSLIYEDKANQRFMLFYNAAGVNPNNGVKAERIGMAFSDDMVHWERFFRNPIFGHENGMITGDAHLQKMGDLYVMFFFGAFWKSRPYDAFNTFACSYDLENWTEWQGEDLIFPTEEYDNWFAHKSFLVKYKGVVYHFYCAVNHDNQRGIAVATSKDLGLSDVHFPQPEPKKKR